MASAADLIVLFLGLETLSIALYVMAGSDLRRLQLAGVGHEVLRARGLLVGLLPLRHRPHLRRHRHAPTSPGSSSYLRRRCCSRTRACCWPAWPSCSWASGSRSPRCRSTVDARRVPGRAHAGHRLHGVGGQGGGLRRPAAGLRRAFTTYQDDWRPVIFALAVLTLLVGVGPGHRADQREADAGLLVDQPRRVHPRRAWRPWATSRPDVHLGSQRCSTCWSTP